MIHFLPLLAIEFQSIGSVKHRNNNAMRFSFKFEFNQVNKKRHEKLLILATFEHAECAWYKRNNRNVVTAVAGGELSRNIGK